MHLFQVTLVVDDYDRAIAHYCGALGFELILCIPSVFQISV